SFFMSDLEYHLSASKEGSRSIVMLLNVWSSILLLAPSFLTLKRCEILGKRLGSSAQRLTLTVECELPTILEEPTLEGFGQALVSLGLEQISKTSKTSFGASSSPIQE